MKILIVGAGGREHAIASKISTNDDVGKIYISKENAFFRLIPKVENINLESIEDLVEFSKVNKIDLTIVGSEELLVKGIVDEFKKNNLSIFGPDKKSAMLEGSKAFSKDFMKKYGVKTAKYKIFDSPIEAIKYIENEKHPIVIKASGLALGKGVIISNNIIESKEAIKEIMIDKKFNEAGNEIVIEEYLEGYEVSILSITDGKTILPFISSKDHKKILEDEKGLNTGGMGAIAPNPYYTKDKEELFIKNILNPTLEGMKKENMDFSGIIFFGLMITNDNVYLLEYNMRLGDPETQTILPLMKNDLIDLIRAAQNKKLSGYKILWEDMYSCTLVLSSKGYPLNYEKGNEITGINELLDKNDCKIFLAGVKERDNKFYTNGGRVLNIVGISKKPDKARELAYLYSNKITFKDKYYRKDIGKIKD